MSNKISQSELDRLLDVCSVQSSKKTEHRMVLFLTRELDYMGMPFEIDAEGNILVIKGQADIYPCIVAHMDTVHDIVDNYTLYKTTLEDSTLKLYAEKTISKNNFPTGIGGDDKCGIYACLYFLSILPACKIVFFTQEESGCVGSNNINHNFFSDCGYIIQLDRKGKSDFIDKHYRGITTSAEFRSKVGHLKKKYGFSTTTGSITDSINLWLNKVGISCMNISAGYYNPHKDNEYIIVDELWNSIKLVENIITTIPLKKYPSLPEPLVTKSYDTSKHYKSKTSYEQCEICLKWTNKHYISPSVHKRVCYTCGANLFNSSNNNNKDTTKQITGSVECCKCFGSFYSEEGQYTFIDHRLQFICNTCNDKRCPLSDWYAIDKNICEYCGYYSAALDKCDYKNRVHLDTTLCTCDICNAAVDPTEGREAEDHDLNFVCKWCLRTFFMEELADDKS